VRGRLLELAGSRTMAIRLTVKQFKATYFKESERAYKPDSVFAAKSRRSSIAPTPYSAAEAIIPLGRRSLDGSMRPTRGFCENAAKRSHT